MRTSAVSRLQKHQMRTVRRLCEEARCYPKLYNQLIKQYKDSQKCNNSWQLFLHMIFLLFNPIYYACLEHIRGADHQHTLTVVHVRSVCVRVQIAHAKSITKA